MDRYANLPFPFGLPWPSLFYETLYVLTWVPHLILALLVAGGAGYVSWRILRPRGGEGEHAPPERIEVWLRDWLPALFSAAVTVGIAPLLFVQLLYQEEFYTAHILLRGRWMLLGPVLISAFYFLYLLKGHWLPKQSRRLQAAVGLATCASFLFAAWCWTENHLTANAPRDWTTMYVSGPSLSLTLSALCRWGAWIALALPVLGATVPWLALVLPAPRTAAADAALLTPSNSERYEVELWSRLALAGLGVSAAAGGAYLLTLPKAQSPALWGVMGAPAFLILLAAAGYLGRTWFGQLSAKTWTGPFRLRSTAGTLVLLFAAAACRETLRLYALAEASDGRFGQLLSRHAAHWERGGLIAFAVFAVLNVAACIWCVRLVLTAPPPADEPAAK